MSMPSNADLANVLLRVAIGIAIVYIIMRFVRRTEEKKRKPEQTLFAKIAFKRIDTKQAPLWYVTFLTEDGQTLELLVTEEVYSLVAVDDEGELTFRGDEFVRFSRK